MKRPLSTHASLTALQRHVSYFDPDRDGKITMAQTFYGLRRLGVGVPTSCLLTLLINLFLGYLTHGKLSSTVSVRDIARGKHPFDSGSFDERGEFDAANFASLFSEPTAQAPFDRLTQTEMRARIVRRGDPKKPFGELGSRLSSWFSGREVELLFCLACDCSKLLGTGEQVPAISKRTLRRFYSGKLLFLLARARAMRAAKTR